MVLSYVKGKRLLCIIVFAAREVWRLHFFALITYPCFRITRYFAAAFWTGVFVWPFGIFETCDAGFLIRKTLHIFSQTQCFLFFAYPTTTLWLGLFNYYIAPNVPSVGLTTTSCILLLKVDIQVTNYSISVERLIALHLL